MKEKSLSRRNLLKMGGVSALLLGSGNVIAHSLKEFCGLTPRQPEGPFYPVADQLDKNNDLTIIEGSSQLALGEIIYLSGRVLDQFCEPVANVVVEVWQACATGRYNHPGDEDNLSPLDKNFQYWGITTTNAQGFYNFKTIVPGHYPAGNGWMRPPHIHFKVHKRGFRELITQMYFEGNPYNEGDRILRDIPRNDWPTVVRTKTPRPLEKGRSSFDMSFDITITKVLP